jgi:hypothetical protein
MGSGLLVLGAFTGRRAVEGLSMQDYHQLDIWQRGIDYTVDIYRFSADLPGDERYNLTLQLRKAATSVPLNIAEGASSTHNP